MPIYSPTGFLDVTNATLRTSNLEAENFKLNGGNIYVSTDFTVAPTLQLITNGGSVTSNTVEFTNPTTGLVVDSNIVVTGNVTAGYLYGDASNVTAVPAAQITGTLAVANGGTGTTTSTGTGSVVLSDAPTFTGDVTFDTNTLFVDSVNDRVGVGTTTPTRNLHVFHPTYGIHRSIYWSEKPGNPATENPIQMGYLGSSDPAHASGAIGLFKNSYEGSSEDETVRIQANGISWFKGGNVGIGNGNPLTKLDIFDTGGCTMRLTTDSATPQGTIDIIRGDNSRSPNDYTFGASNYYDWRIGSDDTNSYSFAIRRKGGGLDTKCLLIDGTSGNITINGTITYNTKQATHQKNQSLAYTTANLGQNIKSVTISADGIAHVHVTGLWKLDTFDGTNGTGTDAIYFNLRKNSTEITASSVGYRMAKLGNANDTDQWRPIVLSWSGVVSSGDQIHVYTSGVENSFSVNELDLNVLVV